MAGPFGFVSYIPSNDKKIDKLLQRAREISTDLSPMFMTLAGELRKTRKMIFSLKGPGGYPDFKGPKVKNTWKKPGRPSRRTRDGNKTAYQNFKLKHFGFMYPLLKATGDLEASLTDEKDSNHISVINKKFLLFGTAIEYATYHQGDRGPGKGIIPLRKVLFLGPDTKNQDIESGGFKRVRKTIEFTLLREMGLSLSEARGALSSD